MSDFRHLWGSLAWNSLQIIDERTWTSFRPLQTIPNRSDLTNPRVPCDFYYPKGGRGREKVKILLIETWFILSQMLVTDKVGATVLIANTWYLSKAEVNLILPESTDLAARTKIIYVVSVLIWTLHKHSLTPLPLTFYLNFSCFRITKWKCLVTRSPTQTGSMARPATKRWETNLVNSRKISPSIGNWYFVNLSAANGKLGWRR